MAFVSEIGAARAFANPAAADAHGVSRFLTLSIDSVAPSEITTTSDPLLAVVATVTNVGDRTVDNIKARIERAPAVTDASALRSTLRLDESRFDTTGTFTAEADRLTPGQHKQFTLSVELRPDHDPSSPTPSLRIGRPGVYPLLINVNGTPAYGRTAHLADARFLLPVLGVPADSDAAGSTGPHAAPVAAPAGAAAVATTMLWPLADRPRRVGGQPGSIGDKVELTDDELATSLAPGGRLDELVGALEFATDSNNDHDHRLADSVCLAIDPDLLVTVEDMTHGYVVPTTPGVVDGPTTAGSGTAAAIDWLSRLRALATSVCTVGLPFGQADLESVAAIDNRSLSAAAVTDSANTVDTVLSTKSVRGFLWPASGTLDTATGSWLRGLGVSTVLLGANAVAPIGATASGRVVTLPSVTAPIGDAADSAQSGAGDTAAGATMPLRAATYDVAVSAALAGVGEDPQLPSITPAALRYPPAADSRQARLQDALGALSFSALDPTAPRNQVIVPPQLWQPNNTEASALLDELADLLQAGAATPRPLTQLIAQPQMSPMAGLVPTPQARADAPAPALRAPTAAAAARLDTAASTLVDDPQRPLTPDDFVDPLRDDLLRVLSRAGRGLTDAPASDRLRRTTAAIDGLLGKVTVLAPGGVYTLASAQSPLVVVARNALPVAVRVRVATSAPGDMKITDIGEQQLPAKGSRPLQIPAKVDATRKLVITFSLTTPTGMPLGSPISVSVRSNAYGGALALITECAGGLLVLLTGRRLWQRLRGSSTTSEDPSPATDSSDDVAAAQPPATAAAVLTDSDGTSR